MMVWLAVSSLWLLALLAGFALFRDVASMPSTLAGAIAGFAFGLAVTLLLAAQPNWVGVMIGLFAFWRLIAGPLSRVAAFLAGLSASLVAALYASAGVPLWQSASVAGLAVLLALAASRRGRGDRSSVAAPEALLVIVALAAPAIGLLPDLLFGWQSAAALNIDLATGRAPPPPVWAIAIVGLAFLAGLLKGAWRRR